MHNYYCTKIDFHCTNPSYDRKMTFSLLSLSSLSLSQQSSDGISLKLCIIEGNFGAILVNFIKLVLNAQTEYMHFKRQIFAYFN